MRLRKNLSSIYIFFTLFRTSCTFWCVSWPKNFQTLLGKKWPWYKVSYWQEIYWVFLSVSIADFMKFSVNFTSRTLNSTLFCIDKMNKSVCLCLHTGKDWDRVWMSSNMFEEGCPVLPWYASLYCVKLKKLLFRFLTLRLLRIYLPFSSTVVEVHCTEHTVGMDGNHDVNFQFQQYFLMKPSTQVDCENLHNNLLMNNVCSACICERVLTSFSGVIWLTCYHVFTW